MPTEDAHPLERNLAAYPWLHLGQTTLFWMPVFVLYFSSLLPPERVLQLEAVYYLGVVLLEVPSGWFSDRIGRKPTLLISALGWTVGSAILSAGGPFWSLVLGQLGLATGMAFFSGTDSALLYDTLHALGRSEELVERQGRARAVGWAAMAVSAAVGGLLGGVELRLAYVLSALGALVGVGAALWLIEPPRTERALLPWHQATAIGRRLVAEPALRWVGAYAVAMTVLNHVPYEVVQPWLDVGLDGASWRGWSLTPPVSGAVLFGTMSLASVAAARTHLLVGWLGPRSTLLAGTAIQASVIGAMAVAIHPLVVPVVLLRSVPGAWMGPVIAQVVHPRLGPGQRATYLSLQSLAGRLAFAGALTGAGWWVGAAEAWTPQTIRAVLLPFGALAVLVGVVLALMGPRELAHTPGHEGS